MGKGEYEINGIIERQIIIVFIRQFEYILVMLSQIKKTIAFIFNHPLASQSKPATTIRYVAWQISTIFNKKPIIVNWFGGVKFLMKKGDHGLTGNYYTGLVDFVEMSFLLHFLRPNDLFVDAGANLGAYTILASSIAKAKTSAFEPVPSSFQGLMKNIEINGLNDLVSLHNVGLSDEIGALFFSLDYDTINHVVEPGGAQSIKIKVVKMDDMISVDRPCVIKIDVEGYEYFVLKGAKLILANSNVKGLIIELNRCGRRYGIEDTEIDRLLTSNGFSPYNYAPFIRRISRLETFKTVNNTIYLKDIPFIEERLKGAEKIKIRGVEY